MQIESVKFSSDASLVTKFMIYTRLSHFVQTSLNGNIANLCRTVHHFERHLEMLKINGKLPWKLNSFLLKYAKMKAYTLSVDDPREIDGNKPKELSLNFRDSPQKIR